MAIEYEERATDSPFVERVWLKSEPFASGVVVHTFHTYVPKPPA